MEPTDFEIDGTRFRAVTLDGVVGLTFATDVMRMFGSAIAGIANGGGPAEMLAVATTIRPDELARLIDTLGTVSQIEVEPGKWRHLKTDVRRDVFRGKQLLQFKWLWESLKVQLADFFALRASE